MEKIDIKIVQLHKQQLQDFFGSQLILDISGSTVTSTLVNTFRRLALDYVPTYAFTKESIFIGHKENTSIFDNDYMRLRLSQLTVPNINIPFAYLPEQYWKNIKYDDPNREKYKDDKTKIEIYINVTNNSNINQNITTNDIKYLEDDEEKNDKFKDKYPGLIIQLRPGETFKCRAQCVLGIGKRSNIWSSVGNAFYEEIDTNKFKLTLESQGQLDEYEILHKCCEILKIKLHDIKYLISDKYNSSSINNQNEVHIKLDNEDHTLGYILDTYLQLNNNIAFSGLTKPDLLQDIIYLKIISVNNNPIKPIIETIDYIISMATEIQNQLMSIGSKYIKYVSNKKK